MRERLRRRRFINVHVGLVERVAENLSDDGALSNGNRESMKQRGGGKGFGIGKGLSIVRFVELVAEDLAQKLSK